MSLIKQRGAASAARTTASKGAGASRFSYRARSAEEVKERANRAIGMRDSYLKQEVDFFTPPAGDNVVRIMPPTWDEAKHYGLDLYLHYGIGPDRNAYLCLDKMKGEPCPICEERARAAAAGEEDLAKALRPRSRVLVWTINRKEEGKGPLAWSMPAGLDKDIVNCSYDQQSKAYIAIDDPSENGFDLGFKRIGTDERTEYSAPTVARRSSPLSDNAEVADRWLEFIAKNPLPSLLVFRDYEEIKAAYAGTTVEHKNDKASAGAAPKLPARRGAAAPAGAAASAPASPSEPVAGEVDLPSWDDVQKASEAEVTELIEAMGLAKEAEADTSIDSLDALKAWVCTRLGIEKPAPAPAAAAGGSWKDRLAKMRSSK